MAVLYKFLKLSTVFVIPPIALSFSTSCHSAHNAISYAYRLPKYISIARQLHFSFHPSVLLPDRQGVERYDAIKKKFLLRQPGRPSGFS